jgi:hypothetical protein
LRVGHLGRLPDRGGAQGETGGKTSSSQHPIIITPPGLG